MLGKRLMSVVGAAALFVVTIQTAVLVVSAGDGEPVTLFGATVPASPSSENRASAELGLRFRPSVDGTVAAVRFFRGTGNTATKVSLWSSTGAKLGSGSTTSTRTGWVRVPLASPVSIAQGRTYVASYSAPSGRYSETDGFFDSPYVSKQITGNGSAYGYGAGDFPNSTHPNANYWVDIEFHAAKADLVDVPQIAPPSQQVISLNKPAWSSVGTASQGNDNSYDSAWNVSGTQWLAYDLSTIPTHLRSSVVLAWYTSPDDGYSVEGMQGVCSVWSGRPYLRDYTVDVNPAPGGGAAPTTGWVTAAGVSGNTRLSRQHLVDFAGYNWIRIKGSGPNGISINMDVAGASAGASDGWLFLGDSITAMYASHGAVTASSGATVLSLTDLIDSATAGQLRPLVQSNGTACAKATDALKWIDEMLDQFPGGYVSLAYGANDGWAGSGDPESFYRDTIALISRIEAEGKVPVLATIPWPNNSGAWQSGIEAMNTKINQILHERPEVVRGPDLYSLTKGNTDLFRSPGDVHPSDSGVAEIRKAWADAMLRSAYESWGSGD